MTLEFYLSEDIIQREDVPFYIIWKGLEIASVQLRFEGFKSISHLYNVRNSKKAITRSLILNEDLESPGYIGGVMTTKLSENPFQEAFLESIVTLKNGKAMKLRESRILHTTHIEMARPPKSIQLPISSTEQYFEVELRGSTTVIINIEELEESELKLVLPSEIQTAVEKFFNASIEGLERIKDEFPQHSDFFKSIFSEPEGLSISQYIDLISSKFEDVKHDRSLIEAISMVFVGAIIGQSSVKDTLFLPLMEYYESNVAGKAFLESPFLCIKVLPGEHRLLFRLETHDLLENPCGKPILVETSLRAKEATLVPLKEIIKVRRIVQNE